MIDAQTISDSLGGKKISKGFLACCPAHEDRHPSLSLDDGYNGKPVVFCNAGCSQELVIATLADRGLWPESDRTLSPQELDAMKLEAAHRRKAREAEDRQEQAAAAASARQRWDAAPPANQAHLYLAKKHIHGHGIRQDGDKLLVPMRDESGQVWALQTIGPDGGKLFSPAGCRTKGLYHSIGKPATGDPVYIAEGFATGAAIHEATGHPVACAMTAGNLEAVAKIIKAKLPGSLIVICGDDDQRDGTDRNPGIEAATKAALTVDGVVAFPGMGRKADFWDLWHEQGPEAIRAAIEAAAPVEDQHSGMIAPLPLPDLPAVQPFDYALLPSRLALWVQDITDRLQCPPDYVAVGAMVNLAAVIGRKIGIRPQERTDWTVVPNLWGLIVGRPGVMKSPALEATSGPLDRLIAEALAEFKDADREARAQKARAKLRAEQREKTARAELKKDPAADVFPPFNRRGRGRAYLAPL